RRSSGESAAIACRIAGSAAFASANRLSRIGATGAVSSVVIPPPNGQAGLEFVADADASRADIGRAPRIARRVRRGECAGRKHLTVRSAFELIEEIFGPGVPVIGDRPFRADAGREAELNARRR